jgi:PAS domain S-box-containing protein
LLLAVFFALAVTVAGAGRWYVVFEERRTQADKAGELHHVVSLKAAQLEAWRREHLDRARVALDNPYAAPALREFLASGGATGLDAATAWLDALARDFGYAGVVLADRDGRPLATAPRGIDPAPRTRDLALVAMRGSAPLLSPLEACEGNEPCLHAIAPIVGAQGNALGALIFHIRVDEKVLALLATGPVLPGPGELALLHRHERGVSYLSHPTAPLGASDLGALASHGAGRAAVLVDERGRSQLVLLREVAGSDWVVLGQSDLGALLAPARRERALVLALVFVLILGAAAATLTLWRRQAAQYQQSFVEEERQREALATRYALLIREAHDILLLLDDEGRVLEFNDRALQAYGYTRGELRERTLLDLTAPADRERALQSAARGALAEILHRRKDGSTFTVEISSRSFAVEGRKFVQCIGRNVTDRRRAEEELRKSEQSLSMTLQSIGDAVIATDAAGLVVRMNPAAEGLTGFAFDEARGRALSEVFRAVDARTHAPVPCFAQNVVSGAIGLDPGADVVLLARYGRETPVASSAGPIRDEEGHITGVVLVFRDVSQRRAAEAALKYQAELLANISDAVMAFTPQGVLRAWNRAAETIYGYSAGEVVGQSVEALLKTELPGGLPAALQTVCERGLFRGEVRQSRKDGTALEIETTMVALRSEGGPVTGYAAVNRDITEHRRLQAQLLLADRMASVGTLAAGVAHEINNPLAYVLANVAYALEEMRESRDAELFSDAIAALEEARDGAGRMREIVRDLKTFSRSDDETRGLIEVDRVLQSAVNMVRNEIKHRARLSAVFGPTPRVEGNDSRLAQVFVNLLVNASQAIPEGDANSNQIAVSTRTGPDGRAIIEIRDSGAGIPKVILGRIFDPFFTTKPVGEGTGLGLAICHNIVSAMGGQIEVESEIGKGSLFRILLPSARCVPSEAVHAEAPDTAAGERRRILVVDDEPMVCRSVSRILSGAHEVVISSGAREALGRLGAGEHFDLILCDLMMPEMTGMDLYERLRSDWPDAATRIAFLTGGAFTSVARTFLEKVSRPCIEKPFEPQALRKVVTEMLGPSQPAAA